ncbi:membrane protein [Helicobacter mustelae]|nr:membrane protein [Helicobacter mustelae]
MRVNLEFLLGFVYARLLCSPRDFWHPNFIGMLLVSWDKTTCFLCVVLSFVFCDFCRDSSSDFASLLVGFSSSQLCSVLQRFFVVPQFLACLRPAFYGIFICEIFSFLLNFIYCHVFWEIKKCYNAHFLRYA